MSWVLIHTLAHGSATLLSYSVHTLDIRSTSSTNQAPRMAVGQREYGSAIKSLVVNHWTVDQGGSICGPDSKLQELSRPRHKISSFLYLMVMIEKNRYKGQNV
jgi:hypothetical protein